MDGQSDDVESEQIHEGFICCVCLDLLYKPVVLACGHVSCFWCIHKSMSGHYESRCPICRHPYHHFPTICQMLHFLLAKMYPVAYKKRENQILEEEKEMDCFSPAFYNLICPSHANGELNHLDGQSKSSITDKPDNLPPDHSPARKVEHCANMELSNYVIIERDNSPTSPIHFTTESSMAQEISINDVLCAACRQLLVRPVVLNCGHVYCETCAVPTDQAIMCHICQSPHPKGFPKVFLGFDHFLKEKFAEEYMARKHMVELREVQFHCSSEAGKKTDPISFSKEENFLQWLGDRDSKLHIGAGCDTCGMYPIIGERYRCMDCKEAIGFDLCGDCYNTRSKLPGRFNQQHRADHRLELVKPITRHSLLLLGLLREQLGDGSPVLIVSDDASENPENVLPLTPSDNDPGNAENVSAAPSTSNDTEEHQNDDAQAAI